MAGNKNQKLKLLYLNDILQKQSDEEHPLSSSELCEKLAELGISAERKSIYSDIDALREFGVDIIQTRVPRRGYYVGSREFEPAEIRMLADAVQASGFISPKKTEELTDKLYALISDHQAQYLKNQIFVNTGTKCENNEIYYNIDKIQTAVNAGKRIRFKYFHRRIINNLPTYTPGREFTVSPYAMMWHEDRYYLICNYAKYDSLSHFRIDRMKKVEIVDENVRHFSEVSGYTDYFDVADYAAKVFKMFSGGKNETIELLCREAVLETIVDRFGLNVPYLTAGEGFFRVIINADVTDGLISWLVEMGNNVVALSPPSIVELTRERIEKLCQAYEIKK
ncbi:MAG: transcriptional regulator [Clostridia bacterium]|nr:transcriptional regulator [Clostridia bacterium]